MAAPKVNFQKGQFLSFRAMNKIHLGQYSFDIPDGSEIGYDGQTVRCGGKEYEVPQLRGLVGSWIVPVADKQSKYVAKPADLEVHSSTPDGAGRNRITMAQASEEEAQVGSVAETTARRDQTRPQQRVAREAPLPADAEPELEEALAIVDPDEGRYQRAVPVTGGSSKESALSESEKLSVAEADARNRAMIAHLTEQPVTKPATFGGTRYDEMEPKSKVGGKKFAVESVDGQDGVEIARYTFSDGAAVGQEGEAVSTAKAIDVTRVAVQPVQVGRAVAHTPKIAATGAQITRDPTETHSPQAARARTTTQISAEGNVGIDSIFEGGATGDVASATSGDDLTDILPDAEVAGRFKVGTTEFTTSRRSEADEIKVIVDNWDVKRHWRARVDDAVQNYGNWPEAVDAICAVESDAVTKNIRTRISEVSTAA